MTFQRLIRPLLFPALLLVGVASALRAQEAVTVAPGRSVTLTAEAGGTPPFTYQWFKNGASVAGATLVSYQIPAAAAADAGQYTVQVTNASGSTVSPAASIFVGTVPQITTHPVSQTVALNGSVSFSVVATGDPAPTYRWRRDGVVLTGATRATLNLPGVTGFDQGSYTVEVSSGTLIPSQTIVSNAALLTVQRLAQTISFAALPARTTQDSPFTVGATASSGLPVSFSVVSGPATVSGSTVTLTGGGTVTLRASQAGSYEYAAATPVEQSFAVSIVRVAQTITFAALPVQTTLDAPLALTATASSGLAVSYTSANPAVATVSGNTVTMVGAGSTVITARQAGDANFLAAPDVTQTLVVTRGLRTQTIAFELPPFGQFGVVPAGGAVTLSVSAQGGAPSTYEWRRNGTVVTGATAATLALANFSAADAGAYTARVANPPGSTESNVAKLKLGSPQVLVPLTVKSVGDAPFTVEAAASSGLAVSFTSSNPAVATVAGGVVTIVGEGVTNLIASQAGNLDYHPASSVARELRVSNRVPQTLQFAGPADQPFSTAPAPLTASASSGLPVAYTVVSGPATLDGATLTLTDAGLVTVRATQAGNAEFSAAPAIERSFNVTTNFLAWQAARFTADERTGPARSGPNAVYGLDDLPNLVKYALGLPPKVNVTAERPALTQDGTRWVFTYERPEGNALGSMQYAVEVSTDLRDAASWSGAGLLNEQVSSAGGKARWRASYPLRSATNPAGARVVAFRLRVTTSEGTAYSPVLAGMTQELPVGQTTALSFPLYATPVSAALMARLTDTGPNFIEASGAGWTSATLGDGSQPHYVRIRSGASAGRVLPVQAAAGAENRLLVDSGGLPLARSGVATGTAGDAFEVLAAQTLAGAFQGVTLVQGTAAAEADQVQVWSGATWISFYKHATRNRWEAEHDAAGTPARDAYALRPDRGLRVRRGNTGPAVLYVHHAGRVADTAVRIVHERPGSTFVALGLPVDSTLASIDPGLGGGVAGGWRTGASPATASTTADLLMVWNPGGNRWTVSFKNTGTARWEEARDGAQMVRDEWVIPAGQPLLVRRVGEAGAQLIAVPLPYSVAR